jgi:putative intracellular protease/amidase
MDNDYGANFNVDDESMNIAELFESFGWICKIVSVGDSVQPCEGAVQFYNRRPVATDYLISEITDLSLYRALVIMPGKSYHNLLNSHAAMELIQSAADRGMVIAAWCRGVSVLAAADVIRGKKVTGHSDYIEEYRKAGAEYIPDNPPPVVDGNIITTVRSKYYRTQMCEAIRNAVEKNQ